MFKEKLEQVLEYESQAAVLVKTADDDCARIIADAREVAEAARLRAEAEADVQSGAVREAGDKEIATEVAEIDKTCRQAISALQAASGTGIETAAADIWRRVIEKAGR